MAASVQAPGSPDMPPTWCSSDKDPVGCALGPPRLWLSLGHGILNAIYYPRIDVPQIRDLGFIVAAHQEPGSGSPGAGRGSDRHRHPATGALRPAPRPVRCGVDGWQQVQGLSTGESAVDVVD